MPIGQTETGGSFIPVPKCSYGVNLVYIRDLLGHSDISTTEIYARADEKMKRKALLEAYDNPTSDELPTWKKDKDLLDWLKSL